MEGVGREEHLLMLLGFDFKPIHILLGGCVGGVRLICHHSSLDWYHRHKLSMIPIFVSIQTHFN